MHAWRRAKFKQNSQFTYRKEKSMLELSRDDDDFPPWPLMQKENINRAGLNAHRKRGKTRLFSLIWLLHHHTWELRALCFKTRLLEWVLYTRLMHTKKHSLKCSVMTPLSVRTDRPCVDAMLDNLNMADNFFLTYKSISTMYTSCIRTWKYFCFQNYVLGTLSRQFWARGKMGAKS